MNVKRLRSLVDEILSNTHRSDFRHLERAAAVRKLS